MLETCLTDNDFTIFALPQQFEQEDHVLAQRWKDLLAQTHPDRFVSQGQAAQRLATQWTMRINEAYQRLKNPVSRAALLCELAGETIDSETNTTMPVPFLMQQMQWRETLEEASSLEQVDKVRKMVKAQRNKTLATLSWLIDEKNDFQQAAQQVRMLMFIDRFIDNIQNKINVLDI